ncbi:MAG TPA: PH domain-containing protein [Rhizomicrobium sp.]|jgi:uncharacterized membrane protein YdbT with pleckstrin-like domain|nr:PH domain-containing protein [Rhizomicrobium sp.]
MASYVNQHLDPGETVVYQASLHWIVYLGPVVMLGAGIAFALPGRLPGGSYAGLAILVVGLVGLLAAWIRQISSEFAVTDRRVIIKTGFVSRRTIELNMSKVESIQVDQNIVGRLLNYGTITVIGTGGTKEPFQMIDDPLAFRHAVQQQQG